jgi:hypothetical protein
VNLIWNNSSGQVGAGIEYQFGERDANNGALRIIGIKDQARAVANLPLPKSSTKSEPKKKPGRNAALQMRCISGGVGRHSLSSAGTDRSAQKRQNPCECKGFDAARRQLATGGKMEAAGHCEPFCMASQRIQPQRLAETALARFLVKVNENTPQSQRKGRRTCNGTQVGGDLPPTCVPQQFRFPKCPLRRFALVINVPSTQ